MRNVSDKCSIKNQNTCYFQ